MENIKNEFEELENNSVGEDFPEQSVQAVPEDIIATGTAGTVYDWQNAPDTVKAPPRVSLDGKIVTIKKAELILPSPDTPWELTKDKKTQYKNVQFKLHYSELGQQEFLSGCKSFRVLEGNKEKLSHPTIYREGTNQASILLAKYAKFKNKDINEISLREFMGYLNSAPKVKIKSESFKNPKDNSIVVKNMVAEFLP